MNMELFQERLIAARKNAKLSQTELADRCKMAQSAVSNCESGKACPRLDDAAALADALGVSLDWLCGGEMQNLKTLGDAARALAALVDCLPNAEFITYNANDELGYGIDYYPRIALTFDGEMYSFMDGLYKQLSIVLDNQADRAVYDFWLNRESGKLDKIPIKTNETAHGEASPETV